MGHHGLSAVDVLVDAFHDHEDAEPRADALGTVPCRDAYTGLMVGLSTGSLSLHPLLPHRSAVDTPVMVVSGHI